jgi:hypothetical protein
MAAAAGPVKAPPVTDQLDVSLAAIAEKVVPFDETLADCQEVIAESQDVDNVELVSEIREEPVAYIQGQEVPVQVMLDRETIAEPVA